MLAQSSLQKGVFDSSRVFSLVFALLALRANQLNVLPALPLESALRQCHRILSLPPTPLAQPSDNLMSLSLVLLTLEDRNAVPGP